MYAKIYEQIFDSSLAEDYQVRHVFEDLLKLADQDGTVNRTPEAIARRTNVPFEVIKRAIAELEKPDPRSQSTEHEGRRIVLLDPDNRDWGWKIVNHGYYRRLRTAEEKRKADAERQRKHRSGKTLSEKSVTDVTECDSLHMHLHSASASPEGVQGEGQTYEMPPARPRPEPTVEAEPQPAKAKQWVDAILSAYRRHGPPSAVELERVRAHVAELVDCGKPQDKYELLCDWCENSASLYRPKDPSSATDPSKWTKWQH